MTAQATTLSQVQADHRWDSAFHVAAAPYRTRCEELKSAMTPSEALAKLQAFPDALVRQACSALARSEKANPDMRQVQAGAAAHPFLAIAMIETALPPYLAELEARETLALQARKTLAEAGHTLKSLGRRPKP